MKTCPNCGSGPYEGNFCGQCGASLTPTSSTPSAPLPQPPSGQVPTAQPLSYNPPSGYGQPPVYGQAPPQPMGYGYAQPPRKSGSKLWLWIGGFVAAVVIGFGALLAFTPDEEPAAASPAGKTDSAQGTKPETKPVEAPAQGPKPTSLPGVTQLAEGQLNATFSSYDWHSAGLLSLADGDGSNVRLTLYEYEGGRFAPAVEVTRTMGELRDVVFGDPFNEGKNKAILVAEKGLLLVDREGKVQEVPETDIYNVYVGDWDGEGQEEMATFLRVGDDAFGFVSRFVVGKESERVGQFDTTEFPQWPAQTFLTLDGRRLLMGVNEVDSNTVEVVLYTLDPNLGLVRNRAQNLTSLWTEPIIGAGAGMLGAKPTLVTAHTHQASTSYLEFFDITADGFVSRGTVTLPDDGEYYPILGVFSGSELEVLAMTPQGKWLLFAVE